MKNQNNFLNSRNYYKNGKAEKKYFTENFSKKFLNFFEKFSLIAVGIFVNILLFMFYLNNYKLNIPEYNEILLPFAFYILFFIFLNLKISEKIGMLKEDGKKEFTLFVGLFGNLFLIIYYVGNYEIKANENNFFWFLIPILLYFLVFFLFNKYLISSLNIKNEDIMSRKILLLKKIITYNNLTIQSSILIYSIILFLLIKILFFDPDSTKEIIFYTLMGLIWVQAFLLTIGSGKHIKNELETINLIKISIMFVFIAFIIKKSVKYISLIFAFIFYPLLKISLKNKKFYNLEVNGNIFIKKGKNIILIRNNSYIKKPLGNK